MRAENQAIVMSMTQPVPKKMLGKILAPFPLKNEDVLMLIESKLKSEDLSFTNKLVCQTDKVGDLENTYILNL